MSANERRAEIIRILEGRRTENVKNLAWQLGVSARTIKYDIENLTCEYKIETVRGHAGCVRLVSGYREYQGKISDEQQSTLLALIPTVNKHSAKILGEILRAHGSFRNKDKIEEVIKQI